MYIKYILAQLMHVRITDILLQYLNTVSQYMF